MTPKKSVVVVDDEPGFCETVKEILEEEGFDVDVASDGRAALQLLRGRTSPPCIVILDLAMPILDGNAVYQQMQQDPALRTIPVVIATSDPSRAPKGAEVMAKPLSIARLLDTVRGRCS